MIRNTKQNEVTIAIAIISVVTSVAIALKLSLL